MIKLKCTYKITLKIRNNATINYSSLQTDGGRVCSILARYLVTVVMATFILSLSIHNSFFSCSDLSSSECRHSE